MKIIDCFMFFDEEMLLDLRLNILDKFVDKFVIVESSYTHSGKEKKLIFDIKKYSKFKEKINYIVLKDPPVGIEEINNNDSQGEISRKEILNALKRENLQRDTIFNGLKDADKNDWIIISDLDEIPDLTNINFNNIKNKIIFFKQKVFYYKLNLELKKLRWIGTKACRKKHLKSPQWLRNIKDKIYPRWRMDILLSEKKYNDIFFVENGGWHFSFVKKPEDIEKKLKSYLHHREYDIDPVGIDKIKDLINSKSVIYDHRVDQTQYKFGGGQKLEKIDLEFLPRHINSNKEKYLDWLEK
jgi:beta-1,4-mannosyl-glycoprotein beta-1,4-N-acetylglucosaminyltransferase